MPERASIASYEWDLSDGRDDRVNRVVNKIYNSPGTFPATLTITTLDGATDQAGDLLHCLHVGLRG